MATKAQIKPIKSFKKKVKFTKKVVAKSSFYYTEQEDQIILSSVSKHGVSKGSNIAASKIERKTANIVQRYYRLKNQENIILESPILNYSELEKFCQKRNLKYGFVIFPK